MCGFILLFYFTSKLGGYFLFLIFMLNGHVLVCFALVSAKF